MTGKEHWPYDDPATLNYDYVDEAVRELCKSINKTDWLKTAESCAGHPKSQWAWSERTYLRLITTDIIKLLTLVDMFNEGIGSITSDLVVQYGKHHSYGISFFVTFPPVKDPEERDIYIDLFQRMLEEMP